jgi:hypothetical protein
MINEPELDASPPTVHELVSYSQTALAYSFSRVPYRV